MIHTYPLESNLLLPSNLQIDSQNSISSQIASVKQHKLFQKSVDRKPKYTRTECIGKSRTTDKKQRK